MTHLINTNSINDASILVITNKEDVTVDFVISQLKKRQISYYRFNTEDIGTHLHIYFDGECYWIRDNKKGKNINFKQFDAIYFRRPKLPEPPEGLSQGEKTFYLLEASTYLEGLYRSLEERYWLNSIFDIRLLENKPYQIQLAKNLGFFVPALNVSNDHESSLEFIKKHPRSIFKPLKSGLIEEQNDRGKVLYTTAVDSRFISNIKTNGSMPIYLQQEITKKFDVRVTVVGLKIFAAKIYSQDSEISKTDWRKSETMLAHEKLNLPRDIEERCLKLCSKFNLDFAAIDFIVDNNNKYWFLEINPNGQWAWIENLLGYPLSEEIVNLLFTKGQSNETFN